MGCPILVEYSYDLNGVVHLVAQQKGYSRKMELRIDSRKVFDSPEPGEGGRDAENVGYVDDAEEAENVGDAANAVNFVTQRASSLLLEMEPGEERDLLSSILDRYEKALRNDNENEDEEEDIDSIEDDLLAFMEKKMEEKAEN